jgi:hypothetical protein
MASSVLESDVHGHPSDGGPAPVEGTATGTGGGGTGALLTRSANVGVDALAKANAHPRDTRITFDEESHTYSVDGKLMPKSVTGLKALVSKKFKPNRVANAIFRSMRANPRYTNPDGSRMRPSAIVRQWNDANQLGTDLHGKIERHVNGCPVDVGSDGVNAKEFAMYLEWAKTMAATGYVPYRSEWVIFHEEYEVAGSIDCIFHNPSDGTFVMIDWKRCTTNGSGFSTSFQNECFKRPLNDLPATKLNEWSLQVNTYAAILEDKYGMSMARMGMVVLHADNDKALEFWHEKSDVGRRLLESWRTLESKASEQDSSDEELKDEDGDGGVECMCDLPIPQAMEENAQLFTSKARQGVKTSGELGLPAALQVQLGGAAPPRTAGGCFQPSRTSKRFGAPVQTCPPSMLARHGVEAQTSAYAPLSKEDARAMFTSDTKGVKRTMLPETRDGRTAVNKTLFTSRGDRGEVRSAGLSSSLFTSGKPRSSSSLFTDSKRPRI